MFYFIFGYKYLGYGCDQIDLHLSYRILRSKIGRILRNVCNAIWECLRTDTFLDFTEELEKNC